VLTPDQHQQPSPSGITSSGRNHQFRASGWTRHYQTFAELMQMIALLALGLALAHLKNHGANKYFTVTILAAALLTVGLVFTAMRTVIVAFVIGAVVIAFRSLPRTYKVVFTFALFLVLAFGAVVVWQTRDRNALLFGDPSSSARMQVARVGLSRIPIHPIFGHGMDAMKLHWTEWGFPGKDQLHLHSTPLQLAFDRGLPMLALWLWMVIAFWLTIARAERSSADSSDTNSYGILLGTLGALTGFLASSLVNYNYGDAEVAMMFWFLMGITNRGRSS
jgi:O-antigen ligase